MYTPKHFEEPRIDVMQNLMREYPLATLVTLSAAGLDANHIPLSLTMDDASAYGVLRGHLARANPLCGDASRQAEVLAIFQAANAYISPSWYATKQETGKVVPTWNYAAVHAYGTMRIIDDTAWIRNQLEALTAEHEAAFAEPWAVSDAPHDFTERLIGQIVGIEISITRLSGKWKVSQNHSPENRNGVIRGLNTSGKPEMAAIVTARAKT